jgi:hypothetical protein
MIPEIKGWRAGKRRKDLASRVQHLREAFHDTEWNQELTDFSDFQGLRAMLFRSDGSMVMVRSRSRSRDSYHLAALIAHEQLLNPMPAEQEASAPAVAPRRRRWLWIAAAVAGAAVVMMAALVAIGVYIGGSEQAGRLAFKKGELYYAKPVTEAEAGRVGRFLADSGYFTDDKAATVRLDRDQDRYRLQLVINPSYGDELLLLTNWSIMGRDISRNALGGKPVDVVLCDDQLKPIKTIPVSAKLTFGLGELYYTEPVTAEQAQAAGDLLRKVGFFGTQRTVTVHLDREQNVYQLRFVVNPSSVNSPEITKDFRILTQAVAAQALGGAPVMMDLCDEQLHTLRSERVEK